jgi:uncharacterized protein YecT (DUF1311 family)
MGCHDYYSSPYICPKPDCEKKSLNQDSYLDGAEAYGRLCDDHWNEIYQAAIERMLAGKSTDELLRDFAGKIFMLQRQSRG